MAQFVKLQFKPGVNRDQTDYSNEGGWWECDKIRFRSGYPQKLGGWVKSTPMTFIGVCRQMWNWVTTYSDNLLALGSNAKVYIEAGGYYYDITPLRDTNPTLTTPDTDNCVYTTNSSSTVVIALGTPHNAETGDYVDISGVANTGDAIGGIPIAEINGDHSVTVINSTAFSFGTDTIASSTVSGSGGTSITIDFEVGVGNAIPTAGYGWGVGTWGRDAWGLGTTGEPINFPQRDWWLDNFDNDLALNIRNGEGYWWVRGTDSDPANALTTRAIRLSDYADDQGFDAGAVPVQIGQLLVSQQDKHLIALGAVPFGSTDAADFDPLLIRWASQDSPGQWTPTDTNSAGDLRVSRGSKIVRGLPSRQEILIWTDASLYTLQFTGTTDVFALQEYASNISIASPRAVATAADITYWMGRNKFYAYTGRVETLPCTLRDHVFNNINAAQAGQIVCGTNEEWNEVWWFYPTADSDFNNAYVVYNHLERIWYYGNIERTAWLDTPLRDYPVGANSTLIDGGNSTGPGILYDHETGLDDDTGPMVSYILSSDFDLGDGDRLMLTRRMIPDLDFAGSTAAEPEATLELRGRNFPGNPSSDNSEDNARVIQTTVGAYTSQVFLRVRARQMAIKIQTADLGVNWQLGDPRLDLRPDGAR